MEKNSLKDKINYILDSGMDKLSIDELMIVSLDLLDKDENVRNKIIKKDLKIVLSKNCMNQII